MNPEKEPNNKDDFSEDEVPIGREKREPNPDEDTIELPQKRRMIEAIKNEDNLLIMAEKVREEGYDDFADYIEYTVNSTANITADQLNKIEPDLFKYKTIKLLDTVEMGLGDILRSKIIKFIRKSIKQ